MIFTLNLQHNRKNALDMQISEMLLNCKQSSYYATFLITKKYIFYSYPTDTANTKTTFPLRVGS